jgi:hypothetical protein
MNLIRSDPIQKSILMDTIRDKPVHKSILTDPIRGEIQEVAVFALRKPAPRRAARRKVR